MKTLCSTVLKVVLGFLCLPLHAQQDLNVEVISTEQGLSQGTIYDILQDREGFIWIGTKDGLNRYDGYEFREFTNDPNDPWSISGNTIVLLFEDSKGRIWAASHNSGINIYDKKTGRFHHIRHDPQDPASLSGNYISTIVEDTSGYFVLGVAEREINMLQLSDEFFKGRQPPQVIRVPMPIDVEQEENLHTLLKGIARDSSGRIWVGGKDILYRLDVQQAHLEPAIRGYSLGMQYANPDGSIWACGANQSLFHWDGTKAHRFLKGFTGARDIRVDKQGNMWFLRADSLFGISLRGWRNDLDQTTGSERFFYRWQPFTPSEDYPLKSMTLDRSGLIWVGTNGHGLFKINPYHRYFFHHLPGISIRSFSVVSPTEFYMLSYNNSWYKQDGTYLHLDPLADLPEESPTDVLLISKKGEFWIRQPSVEENYFKIKRYNPQTGESKLYETGWYHYDFQPIIESRDGSVWMAGFNKILTQIDPLTGNVYWYDLANGKSGTHPFDDKKVISYEYSTALYEDRDGVLWVGTEQGFIKCERPSIPGAALQVSSFKNNSKDSNSLSYNHVTCFLDDPVHPEQYLWVCTKGGGLNRLDKATGNFKRFTKKNGLPDNVVYGILTDEQGNIWGSTNKGLFCMIPKQGVPESYTFRNFSKADGLQENEFNIGAYAKLPDGKLLFGGVNGFNIFNPKEILATGYEPPVYITNIFVNNHRVLPQDETGVLKNTIETTRKITLSHWQDILTLEFSAVDFSAPDRNKYRYQLVGADDTWVQAGNRRSATFLNLQPGDYTFRLQGSNSQGVWSNQIAELQIQVLPPWWKTWWAYLFYTLLITTAIWLYSQFSINRAKLKQQLVFEKREADRIRELDVLKTQFYMNMTHEFRTPLTIILGMARQVKNDPKEYFNTGLDMIIRNGQNLLSLVNKMLNLSKLESGKMTLELVQGDVVQFLRNIVESFRSFAANKEIQMHFLPEVDSVVMDFDVDKLQQVVSNLISNAFKFTPEGGHIYFGVRRENGTLVIRVKDTGRGIPPDDLEKVFDRFYQVDNSSTRKYEGTGIGLSLSKELVILMRGTISVNSPPAGAKRGAEFVVALPIGQNAAKKGADLKARPVKPSGEIPPAPAPPQPEKTEKAAILNQKKEVQPSVKKRDKALILLVEDNEDVAAYVTACLTGYQLAIARDGQEGLEIATEIIPDLVISDVMMPVMDGFEFCRRLKSDKRTDHIPVIMLTARADLDSKLEGLERGANVYLPKPYEKRELLLSIQNLFELRDKLQKHHQSLAALTQPDVLKDDSSLPEDAFVERVRQYIEAHICDFDLSVQQLAREFHLSHSQFGRKLDALTGFSPNRFIRFIRLNKAKELLKTQDLSITAVAFDCGFSDPSYFSRVFKKEFGKTPIEWKEDAA